MTDFNAEDLTGALIQSIGATAYPVEATFTDTSNVIVVGGSTVRLKMRGRDSSNNNYVTWNVVSTPDPNGAQASASNTTPALVGTIVAGSGFVVSTW